MKKGILLSLLACLAIVGIFGGGTASATVLCKTATNPCTGGTYGKGTVIKATLAEGQAAKFLPTWTECNTSEISLEVTNAGGSGTAVSGTINTLSFTKCGCAVNVLKKGSFSIQYVAEGKGTLELSGVEITAPGQACATVTDCIYAGNFTSGITLEGGSQAAIRVQEASIPFVKPGPLACGSEITWYANFGEVPGYAVIAPEPLYVEAS